MWGEIVFTVTIALARWLQAKRNKKNIVVSNLIIYPIKGCKGINLPIAKIASTGFQYDRQFVLVDKNGYFLSQRKFPKMALVDVSLDEGRGVMIVASPQMERDCLVSLKYPEDNSIPQYTINIWGDKCEAIDVGSGGVNEWFDRCLGTTGVRLMRMHKNFTRKTDPDYAPLGQTVFSDGYPFLLVSEASIEAVNDFLDEAITFERFRPNITISGCEAFEEDKWKQVIFQGSDGGRIALNIVKPCARCTVPNVDPTTGEMDAEHKVTKALQKFRTGEKLNFPKPKWKKEVFMAQNLDHEGRDGGRISVGDQIFFA